MVTKRRSWKLMLFIASFAYLLIEIMFNAKLVEIASAAGFNADDNVLHLIELFGRAISGVGVSLLILDVLPARLVDAFFSRIFSIAVIFMLIWPTIFFGQKKLIDTYLIEPSSAKQRKQALASVLLKQAMTNNALSFEGIDYDAGSGEDTNTSPEDMTFLAIFGGLIYVDDNIIDRIKDQQNKIISNYVRARSNSDFASYIQSHRDLYTRLSNTYSKEYVPASERYNKSMASVPQKQAEAWSGIETQLAKGWSNYETARKSHIARAEVRAQEYGPKIFDHFKRFNDRCFDKNKKVDERCALRENTNYKNMITKAGYGYIDKNYWLIEEQISTSTNLLNTAINAVVSGGATLALQAASKVLGGDGGWRDKKYSYTNEASHYRQRFLELPAVEQEFVTKTGYSTNLSNFDAFRAHSKTQEQVRASLIEHGLSLPTDWTTNDSQTLNDAVRSKVIADTKTAWEREIKAKNLTMAPNLSWREFEVHKDVQARIKADMKENYVPGLRASWSDQEFSRRVIEPAVARKVKEVENQLTAIESDFADGGRYEDIGKNSLRTVIVPPISLILSLFLICLTMLKLPIKLVGLFRKEINGSEKKTFHTALNSVLAISPILLVMTVPFYIGENKYSSKESNVNYFINQIEDNSYIYAFWLKWLIHAQPMMQPFGLALAEQSQFMQKIEPIADVLEKLDTADIMQKE
uniref:Uncharacterized protein n=1 Tax=Rheinheimera sp. BAL341 TaxID=1708203 RepID=A0A486XJD1_9GAMM